MLSKNKQGKKIVVREKLPPPAPYESWLEYAIINTSTRSVQLDSMMGLYPVTDVLREDLDLALRDEYIAFCKAARIELSAAALKRLQRRFNF